MKLLRKPPESDSVPNTRRPITVAHVVEGCQGGVGTVVRNLIDSQAADPNISAVHLFADPNRLGDMLLGASAQWHTYLSSRRLWEIPSVARTIVKGLASVNPDVVFLHSTFPGVYGRVFRKPGHWATIYCAHGWAFAQRVSAIRRLSYRVVERLLSRRCDGIISISFSEFDEAIAAGIKAPVHKVVYHGLPMTNNSLEGGRARARDELAVGFVGRFDYQKGLDILLKAAEDPRLSRVKFLLIGGSTLGPAPSIPKYSNVEYVGWVPNSTIGTYLNRLDALVIPSRWEGFGIVALEGMRNGKAIIASRVGGLAELVVDGVNGRLFNVGDVENLTQVLVELKRSDVECMGKMGATMFNCSFHGTHVMLAGVML